MTKSLVITCLVLTPMTVLAAAGGDDPISADRPGLSDPPTVLSARVAQLEVGVQFVHDERARDSESMLATTARLGLGHRLEARLTTDGLAGESRSGGDGTTWGRADLSLGMKVRITDDIAIIPMVSMPTGTAGMSSDGFDPTFKVSWQRRLSPSVQVGGEGVIAEDSDDSGHVRTGALGLGVSRDLPRHLNAFGEVHGIVPAQRHSGPDWTFDAGLSRIVKNDVQLDVSMGRGLTEASSAWFVATGIAIRHRPGHRGR